MLKNLEKYRILLGSKSPRRRELMQMLHIPFTVVGIQDVEETYPDTLAPLDVPQFLSCVKADAYLKRLGDDELIITADTLVIKDGKIYGKPHSEAEAESMLTELSGSTHQVVTGVTVSTHDKRDSFTAVTHVRFCPLTPEEIRYYVEHFSPLDKAGSYGIQEWIGAVAVENIDGSFYNVMGLPIHRLYQQLKMF